MAKYREYALPCQGHFSDFLWLFGHGQDSHRSLRPGERRGERFLPSASPSDGERRRSLPSFLVSPCLLALPFPSLPCFSALCLSWPSSHLTCFFSLRALSCSKNGSHPLRFSYACLFLPQRPRKRPFVASTLGAPPGRSPAFQTGGCKISGHVAVETGRERSEKVIQSSVLSLQPSKRMFPVKRVPQWKQRLSP